MIAAALVAVAHLSIAFAFFAGAHVTVDIVAVMMPARIRKASRRVAWALCLLFRMACLIEAYRQGRMQNSRKARLSADDRSPPYSDAGGGGGSPLAANSLTTRRFCKTTSTGNAYLRKTIARHRLTPALAVAFAGRLDYRRYSWRDRQIILFIMLLPGSRPIPTPASNILRGARSMNL